MRIVRQETCAEFRAGRKAAFSDSDDGCVKCWRNATEAHHVYGPADNGPGHLRPLCYWCHLVAPAGEAYWAWEASGESGPDRFIREEKGNILAMQVGSGAEVEELFRLATVAVLFSGIAKHRLGPLPRKNVVFRMAGDIAHVLSGWERRMVGERARKDFAVKRKRGERTGNIPYGMRAIEGGKLVADERESVIADRIRTLREAGESLRDIAVTLNAEGLRTRAGSEWVFR